MERQRQTDRQLRRQTDRRTDRLQKDRGPREGERRPPPPPPSPSHYYRRKPARPQLARASNTTGNYRYSYCTCITPARGLGPSARTQDIAVITAWASTDIQTFWATSDFSGAQSVPFFCIHGNRQSVYQLKQYCLDKAILS